MEKLPNNIFVGILIGAGSILAGYGIVSVLFDLLVNVGLMEEATASASGKRIRTIYLLAICFNIIFIQIFNKRKNFNIQRGVAIITVLAALAWVIYFKDTLFTGE